jgi:hypothetical protein
MSYEVKISVSGFTGHNSNYFPKGFKEKLTDSIAKAKESKEWSEYSKTMDQGLGWMAGRRYQDNERVALVIMGEMQSAVSQSLGIDRYSQNEDKQPLIEMRCLAYANNLDIDTTNEWIFKALDYSGSCDHWYTYEKDWS